MDAGVVNTHSWSRMLIATHTSIMEEKNNLGKSKKWSETRQNRKSTKFIYYFCHALFPPLPGRHSCHLQCLFSAFWAPPGFAFNEKNTQTRDEKKVIPYFFIFFSVPSDGPTLRSCLQNPNPKYWTDSTTPQPAATQFSTFQFKAHFIYGPISTVQQWCLNLLGKESQYMCVFWVRLAPVANKSEIYTGWKSSLLRNKINLIFN